LLENIGTHVDPIILIRKIPNGMEIPGLRNAIVKILQDYSMQTALWFQCKRILSSDVTSLMRKQMKIKKRPMVVREDTLCDACGRPLMATGAAANLLINPVFVSFLCGHKFHDECLPLANRDTCSICRGNMGRRHL